MYEKTGKILDHLFQVSEFVPGSIYIDMEDKLGVCKLVETFSMVFLNCDFEYVSMEDIRILQSLQSVRLAIGTWVRVMQKELYHNNICNIVKFMEDDQN